MRFIFISKNNFNSRKYWEKRYLRGDTSGVGSYGRLAQFKANIINSFVKKNRIKTVIEFGCGDGNQIKLLDLPNYIGLDVSRKSINICKLMFKKDRTKSFLLYSPASKIIKGVHTISITR